MTRISPSITLDRRHGSLSVMAGGNEATTLPWVVAYKRPWGDSPFLRVHSACLFSESFGSQDCDCALQLTAALDEVSARGGAVVYLYQEGRGLGLVRKIEAISVEQQAGVDTAEAYKRLGFELDPRQYGAVEDALDAISFPREVRLWTNNPRKVAALEAAGYKVIERVQLKLALTERVSRYFRSKVQGLGHHDPD